MDTTKELRIVVRNLKRLLKAYPQGLPMSKIPSSYFENNGRFAYIFELGFNSWEDVFQYEKIKAYAEVVKIRDELWVQLKDVKKTATGAGEANSN